MEAMGSCLTNKYSEGQIGHRYYGGNEYIDEIEKLCKERCLKAFRLNPEEWDVNVQPYSGSPANFAVYHALLQPNDRVMGLDLPSGGHLTHGYYTAKKKISSTSVYFQSLPYHVNSEGYVDYEELEKQAKIFLPKLIICGASAYPRDWEYDRLRKIADSVGAYLLCDMAHYAGLVAAQEHNSPFEYCDVVTSTTHKSLRGPRAGIIFSKKQYSSLIDFAVFPGIQGGPHNHQIAAIATQMREVQTEEFKQYAINIKKNAKALAEGLIKRGYTLMTNGTDNHLILWNLRPLGITGNKMEKFFEEVSISTNKNSIAGDTSALTPHGIRLGTPALTTRGFTESDFDYVAELLHEGIQIALQIQKDGKDKKLETFIEDLHKTEQVKVLREKIENFASKFPMPTN